jgi:hypothetical protein
MGKVIKFPGHGEAGIKKALKYFNDVYKKAGLSAEEIETAMAELEPIVHRFLVRREFVFELSGSFTDEQIQAVSDAHNAAMHDAISYFGEQMWLALCHIGGLIGRNAQNA